jgi:hypothetical protein
VPSATEYEACITCKRDLHLHVHVVFLIRRYEDPITLFARFTIVAGGREEGETSGRLRSLDSQRSRQDLSRDLIITTAGPRNFALSVLKISPK